MPCAIQKPQTLRARCRSIRWNRRRHTTRGEMRSRPHGFPPIPAGLGPMARNRPRLRFGPVRQRDSSRDEIGQAFPDSSQCDTYPPARKARTAPKISGATFSRSPSRSRRTGTRSLSSGFKPVSQAWTTAGGSDVCSVRTTRKVNRSRSSAPLYGSAPSIQRSSARTSLTPATYAVSFFPIIPVSVRTSFGNAVVVDSR